MPEFPCEALLALALSQFEQVRSQQSGKFLLEEVAELHPNYAY